MPVCAPVLPRITEDALLPRVPLALSLLIVLMASVPFSTLNWPVKVLAPERVRVPEPDLVRPPDPLMTLETVVLPVPPMVSK